MHFQIILRIMVPIDGHLPQSQCLDFAQWQANEAVNPAVGANGILQKIINELELSPHWMDLQIWHNPGTQPQSDGHSGPR
jgi:hypothetical protein